MKLNIEVEFVDKITGELHKIGDVITVTKARGKKLLADDRNLVSLNEDDADDSDSDDEVIEPSETSNNKK